jgi:hypothetical protein
MHGCCACQERLLEHLYDLLEGGERQEVENHLAGCPACQAALAAARGQQKLLASAARAEFPQVVFQAPTEAIPAPTVRMPQRTRRLLPRGLGKWAAAAGVLVAVGLAIPGFRIGRDYANARAVVHDHQKTLTLARDRQKEAADALVAARNERDKKVEDIHKSVRARELKLVVTGPRTVQSGAPTEYQVRTTDLNNMPTPAQIVAKVMDQNDPAAPIATAPSFADDRGKGDKGKDSKNSTQSLAVARVSDGVYRFTVPPSLPLKPGRQLTLLVSAKRDIGSQAQLSEQVTLTAPIYLTHLTTDKPMYQPGEVVHFRSLTLDRFSLAPAQQDFALVYTLTTPTGEQKQVLQGGNGLFNAKTKALLTGPDGKPVRGIGAGWYLLPADAPGGEYFLTVSEMRNRFPAQKRNFVVNHYQKPQLDKKLEFGRSSYGAGDEVLARCQAMRASAGPVKDRPVRVTVQIDGKTYGVDGKETAKPFELQTDELGNVPVKFRLPEKIERGQASLAVTFVDRGAIETIVRPIPVIVNKLLVEFFPEGGDLVAGLPNRVYFEARTPLGKPADLEGHLLENGKPLGVSLATLRDAERPGVNQGRGVFSFSPRPGCTYSLQVDSPAKISERFVLPKMRDQGVVMTMPQAVVNSNEPIRVKVLGAARQSLMIGVYCRGRLLDSVRLEPGQTEASLRPTSPAGGVCRVTVFEEQANGGTSRHLKPLAERLIFRLPAERVDLDIHPDRRSYVPGQKATISLAATDEKEKFKPVVAMVAVVDKSVLTLADEKTARTMPTHLLLASEVRRPEDLEYADFLLEPHPKAAASLDLLLGTQGWRRFAEQDPGKFREKLNREAGLLAGTDRLQFQEAGERLLVLIGQSQPREINFDEEKVGLVEAAYADQAGKLESRQNEAMQAVRQANENAEYQAAVAQLADFRARVRNALPLIGALLLIAAVLLLAMGIYRQQDQARSSPYYVAATACAVGFALFVVAPQVRNQARKANSEREVALKKADDAAKANNQALPQKGLDAGRLDDEALPGDVQAADKDGAPDGKAPPMAPGPIAAHPKFAKVGGRAKNMGRANWKDRAVALGKPGGNAGLAKKEAKKGEGKGGEALLEENGARFHGGFGRPGNMARDPIANQVRLRQDRLNRGLREREAFEILPPMEVREYAHQNQTRSASEARSDFTETLYWHPALVLPNGKGEISFDLCDSVTTFQVTAFVHTTDGRLGAASRKFDVRLPLTLSPKLPMEVTAGDTLDLPITVGNNTFDRSAVQLALKQSAGLTLEKGQATDTLDVRAEGTSRRLFRFKPSIRDGLASLQWDAKAGPLANDAVRGVIRVVPEGFPVANAHSDVLEGSLAKTVELPANWVKGTLQCRVNVFPSTLADLQKGLDGLLQEPNGCFEQTSTSNYPNLLVLDYLKESRQANPAVEARARTLLARGYQKLTSFECEESGDKKRRGYEWFGGTAPAHEALTAYGLLQFRDMTRYHDVDPAMLKRTRDYLMAQRDGSGGFKRNPRALDTFGRAPDHITNAYIVWSLTESGKDDDVTKELSALHSKANESKDPYFLALIANALINRGQSADAAKLLKTVADVQKDDGHLEALQTSITGSGGRDLHIETTSLAVLGWLKANPGSFNQPVQKAIKWIGQQRGAYGAFGSTQATILALKALIAHTKANKKTAEAGELRLFVDDKEVAAKAFAAGATETLTLEMTDAEKLLKPGKNKVRVEITGKNVFPCTLSWAYQTLQPLSAAGCPVRLTTTLAKTELNEGDAVRLTVRAKNVSGKGQGMAVAIVGLPGGLALPEDLKQLKDYIRLPADGKRPLIGAFEVRARELVLYWRDLAKDQTVELPVDLVARVPGVYSGPASRAYLYYNADRKHWVEPLKASITAKQAN